MKTPSVACFGEVLLRIGAPDKEPLMQSPSFRWHVGGAEANVAVGLAKLGVQAHMVSTVAANPLGDAAIGELRRHGVRDNHVKQADGRLGLYFYAPGAGQRASSITYDRAHSAFAAASAADYDMEACLDGVDWLHISGVTPAIGANAAEAACSMAEAAAAANIDVSYDFNHRAKMWAAWGGDPASYIKRLVNASTLLFANDHDLGMVLPLNESQRGRSLNQALLAFEHLPRLQCLTSAFRTAHSVEHHSLKAALVTRAERVEAGPVEMPQIVDRIGGGDAYAAAVIASRLSGHSTQQTVDYGLAASVHKHTLVGDLPNADWASLDAIVGADSMDVQR
ncbi:MAG: sugar kinase [Pseudomonadota bacterium]